MASASTEESGYGWTSRRVERLIPVAGSQIVALMYGEIAQRSVELPNKYFVLGTSTYLGTSRCICLLRQYNCDYPNTCP